jgi:tryptophan-rich sensory protein
MRRDPALLFAASAVATAQLLGARYNPSPAHPRTAVWYAALRKPAATPPGWVFGAAWTGLDALLAYAGYRLLRARPAPARAAALGAWGLNLLGIAGFSWVLFGRKRLDEALGVTGAMAASAVAGAATAAAADRRAAAAYLPLVGWVAFATYLQEEVWRRN